ncbi:hypothetical protein [Clostridium sp. SM-530-WT-3G]|uniref:hypothetical protein n=1 Tax=Clostridium sp. SM-530-WT-3G TaxID=2725303 RepID=UPI00145ED5F5|nr:hypothetical protein [Clostridium sp. SM-530-WT-3G]NME81572.1 hypothetical protein [Clostridium sp. SM-530-WT-3G]
MKKGIQFEIEEALLRGESRESLNLKYNKGTVTRVFNKLNKNKDDSNIDYNTIENKDYCDKSIKLEKIINEMFNLLYPNNSYEIKINIKFKDTNIKKTVKEGIDEEIINPFEIYNEENKVEMIDKLKEMNQQYLLNLIKKYFKYNGSKMKKLTVQELSEYIFSEVEKVVNLGQCFR